MRQMVRGTNPNELFYECQMLIVQMPKSAWSETLQIHNRINDWIANLGESHTNSCKKVSIDTVSTVPFLKFSIACLASQIISAARVFAV